MKTCPPQGQEQLTASQTEAGQGQSQPSQIHNRTRRRHCGLGALSGVLEVRLKVSARKGYSIPKGLPHRMQTSGAEGVCMYSGQIERFRMQGCCLGHLSFVASSCKFPNVRLLLGLFQAEGPSSSIQTASRQPPDPPKAWQLRPFKFFPRASRGRSGASRLRRRRGKAGNNNSH